MADDKQRGQAASGGKSGFLGSLREALAAAGREDPTRQPLAEAQRPVAIAPPQAVIALPSSEAASPDEPTRLIGRDRPADATVRTSAAEAAREARGGTPNVPPVDRPIDRHVEFEAAPTTRVVRGPVIAAPAAPAPEIPDAADRTKLVRGKPSVKRGAFVQDPVVGWLVIVGGPGLGAFRPIFEGNNTVGRAGTQRIPIDFGDDAISSEEQAYIRYDSSERSFLFVPNLTKTNVVSVNDKRPTAAVTLAAMDVIIMGRTQLVFVPFCGSEFDWSELPDAKG